MKLRELLSTIAGMSSDEDKLLDLDVKVMTKVDRMNRVKAIQDVKLQDDGNKFTILLVTTPEPSSGK